MAEVRMPKMGDGMEEGTVLRWLKAEGDMVKVNETIAEIETDKANVEMPAEETGILSKIIVGEGETVPVGAVIGFIGDVNATVTQSAAALIDGPAASIEAPEAPLVAPPAVPIESSNPTTERVKTSPLARKLAEGAGIDLAQVKGTGPGGRVVEKDIKAFLAAGGPSKHVSVPDAPAKPLAAAAAPTLGGEDVDVSKMRKAIARRTVQSKQTVPHFYLVMPVEMDYAMQLLSDINVQNPDGKITVNDLIVKACAVSLAKFPQVNVSWTPEDKVRYYDKINIGIAAVTDQGLAIPVVQDCGSKTLREISADAKTLIKKARTGTITPQEMSGSTFSTSNLGMFGVEEFLAIINPPDSCMLAIGAVQNEVVVKEDGTFAASKRMRITLSCDHRTVDGVLGATFLQEVKRLLEAPLNLLS